jgi:hypothetical protein
MTMADARTIAARTIFFALLISCLLVSPLSHGYRLWMLYERADVLKIDHRGNEAVRRPRELAREARPYFFLIASRPLW